MLMRMERWLLVMVLSVVAVGRVRGDCSSEERDEMQKKFTTCSTKYRDEHWDKTSALGSDRGDERLAATCLLFSNIVDTCGDHWKECNEEEQIRGMKDIHIVALTKQYSDVGDVNQCKVVREYKDSGRASYEYGDDVEDAEGDGCGGQTTAEVQRSFQKCSHLTATTVYRTIQEMTDPEAITDHICTALNKIGADCVDLLRDCYNDEDLARTKEQHILEMKKYFLKMPLVVEAKVGNDSLNNCQQRLDTTEATIAPEEYDETNDINGNDPYHHESDDDDDIEPGNGVASTPAAEVTEGSHLAEPSKVVKNEAPESGSGISPNEPTTPADLYQEKESTAPPVESTTKVYVRFAHTPSHTTGHGATDRQTMARDGNSGAGVVITTSKLLLLVCLVGLANWL